MNAQDIINDIEREEKEIKEHKQDKPRNLNIEIMKEMTIGQIKEHHNFFKIQEQQELTDKNITKCLSELK
jgi:hypothetical protein